MGKKKIIATIEARMGSTRLPGKMALELAPGLPALGAVIERVRRASTIDEIVVATTMEKADDALAAIAERFGARCFRGSEADVLGRVVGAGESAGADALVLVTGDGSCVSPTVLDTVVAYFLAHNFDLVSNCVLRDSYPIGIDAQVVSLAALARAHALAVQADPNNLEHANFFIKHHPDLFRIHQFDAPAHHHRPEFAFVLDTPQDLAVIRAIYARLYPTTPAFDLDDLLALVAREPNILRPLDGLAVNRIGY